MELTTARRGTFVTMNYLSPTTGGDAVGDPLSELIMDYFDKQVEHEGLRLADYDFDDAKALEAGEAGHCFRASPSTVVHRAQGQGVRSRTRADGETQGRSFRARCSVPIQAAIGGRVLARETVKAKRKDVLAVLRRHQPQAQARKTEGR